MKNLFGSDALEHIFEGEQLYIIFYHNFWPFFLGQWFSKVGEELFLEDLPVVDSVSAVFTAI